MRKIFAFLMVTMDGYDEGPAQEFDFWNLGPEFARSRSAMAGRCCGAVTSLDTDFCAPVYSTRATCSSATSRSRFRPERTALRGYIGDWACDHAWRTGASAGVLRRTLVGGCSREVRDGGRHQVA